MKSLKVAALTLALMASASAFAAQKDITVIAEVDPTLDLLQSDGSALPQTVRMNYVPGVGLQPVSIQTKIFTNDIAKPVTMRVAIDPVLAPMTTSGAGVPLAVKYGGKPLTMSGVTFTTAELNFISNGPTGTPPVASPVGSSQNLPLQIEQKTQGELARGSYQGVVSVVLTQGT